MGLFWDLFQQTQLSSHARQAGALEDRVAYLEGEVRRLQGVLHQLIGVLEQHVGRDLDGDGRIP